MFAMDCRKNICQIRPIRANWSTYLNGLRASLKGKEQVNHAHFAQCARLKRSHIASHDYRSKQGKFDMTATYHKVFACHPYGEIGDFTFTLKLRMLFAGGDECQNRNWGKPGKA